MSQQDYTIDNSTGAAVRADLNATLQAIVSANSGTSEPSTMFAYQIWADTTANKLKIRNGANNAWYVIGALDTANLGLMLASFFPNINGNVTATDEELNILDGFTGVTADLTYAKDLRATGVTSSEFDTLDGVTSSIQTQINTKALTAGSSSQTFSVDTPTNSNHAATKSYIDDKVSGITSTSMEIYTAAGSFTWEWANAGSPDYVYAVMIGGGGSGSGNGTVGNHGDIKGLTKFSVSGNKTVVVGSGGAAVARYANGIAGGNSTFGGLTASGGSGATGSGGDNAYTSRFSEILASSGEGGDGHWNGGDAGLAGRVVLMW
jgi:hypothetical protein